MTQGEDLIAEVPENRRETDAVHMIAGQSQYSLKGVRIFD